MEQPARKSWWGRNWKWVVPVGCLVPIVVLGAFVALILSLVFGLIKSSDVYQDALELARAEPAVQEALGSPIEAGFFVTGNISVSGNSGQANLSVPLSGPEGEATLYVVASKSAGQWTFSTLVFEVEETGARIDLLDDEGPGTGN